MAVSHCIRGDHVHRRTPINGTLMALVAMSLVVEPALAELDEIVVTARKREEKLQDLPLSVTALPEEAIERLGIRDLTDVVRYTPGVNIDNGFGLNDQRLVIRGLSPSRGRPNNAILVDGIDITTESVSTAGGSMLLNQRLLDIRQVEVVKGPQSALYGRAAFTGAIQYVTKDPGDDVEITAGVDVGDFGRRYVRAAVAGPLTDTFGLRLNGMGWNHDGFYKEGFTGASLGGGRGKGLSLTGKLQPNDIFSARARVSYSEDQYDQQATFYDPANTIITPPANALTLPNISLTQVVGLFAGRPADVSGRTSLLTANPKTGQAYPGGEIDVLNGSLALNLDVSGGRITSYTGYTDVDSGQIFDGDFDVRPNATGTLDIARGGTEIDFKTDTRIVSQELRFASDFDGPANFTVGALYWDEKVRQVELGVSALAFPFGPAGAAPGYFNTVAAQAIRIPNEVDRDTESSSIYGLLELQLNDLWKLTFEGRYAREKMRVRGAGCDPAQNVFGSFPCGNSTPDIALVADPFGAPGVFTQLQRLYAVDSVSSNYSAPRVIIEYSPNEDALLYASVSKGVKPGGISTVAAGAWMDREADGSLDELKFDDETLIAYELGAKTTWFDRRVTVNGALFYQDYADKQLPVQRNVGVIVATAIDNVGDAEVRGLELEAVWQVTDYVRAQLGYTYLTGEYERLSYQTNSANSISRAGNCTLNVANDLCTINLTGSNLEDIPRHSLIAIAGWYPSLGSGDMNALLEADVKYQSERYVDEFNDRSVSGFSIVNLRAGIETTGWDAVLYVNNVFDDDTVQSWSPGLGLVATAERTNPNLFAFPAEGFSIAPPPRHWGVRANVRF